APNVGIWLPTGLGGALANFGLAFLGKASVNLNYTAGTAAVRSAVAQAGIRVVVTSKRFIARVPLNLSEEPPVGSPEPPPDPPDRHREYRRVHPHARNRARRNALRLPSVLPQLRLHGLSVGADERALHLGVLSRSAAGEGGGRTGAHEPRDDHGRDRDLPPL